MSFSVEVKPHTIVEETQWGKTEKQTGLDRVYVNNKLAGYAPNGEKDLFRGVFHPLSGFPNELCPTVVDRSAGKLSGHLKAPKPQPQYTSGEDVDE